MRIALFPSFRNLSPAPRRFLCFMAFNIVSFQCFFGSAMVLFARKLDMPASSVGFLLAALPLSLLLVILSAPLVTRFGSKRLMMGTWLIRNLCISLVFFVPWAATHYGTTTAGYILFGATLGFSMVRAIGAGGWFPWLHEIIPEEERGTYFSTEIGMSNYVSIVALIFLGFLLQGDPSPTRFLIVYAIGLTAGLLSLAMMTRVPGGGVPPREKHTTSGLGSYRKALSDAPYMKFAALASLSFCTMAWLGSAVVLYMRDVLFLSPRHIMFITAAGCLGVYLTVRFWGRFADHSGSGRAMFKTLLAHALVALLFLLLPPGAKWSVYAIGPVVILATVFGSAFASVAQRALLHYVQETGKIGYTNFWMFGTSLAMGITPIIVGFVVDRFGLDGFRFCFALSGIAGLLCALGNFFVVRDGSLSVKPSLAALMNPALPVRTLARIAWITLGKHESRHTENQERTDEK